MSSLGTVVAKFELLKEVVQIHSKKLQSIPRAGVSGCCLGSSCIRIIGISHAGFWAFPAWLGRYQDGR